MLQTLRMGIHIHRYMNSVSDRRLVKRIYCCLFTNVMGVHVHATFFANKKAKENPAHHGIQGSHVTLFQIFWEWIISKHTCTSKCTISMILWVTSCGEINSVMMWYTKVTTLIGYKWRSFSISRILILITGTPTQIAKSYVIYSWLD